MLSGNCLTLPLVRHGRRRPQGRQGFLRRRARRILPPYYAALVLAAAANWILPAAYLHVGDNPGTTAPSAAAHLLFYHNLHNDGIIDLNRAFWHVAGEWQIDLFFPLLILAVRKQPGLVLGLAFSIALGWSLGKLAGQFLALYHLVGLFEMAQAAAILSLSRPRWLRVPVQGWRVATLPGVLLLLVPPVPRLLSRRLWF